MDNKELDVKEDNIKNNNKKKIIIVISSILIVIILIVVLVLVLTKDNTNEKDNTNKDEDIVNKEDSNNEEIKENESNKDEGENSSKPKSSFEKYYGSYNVEKESINENDRKLTSSELDKVLNDFDNFADIIKIMSPVFPIDFSSVKNELLFHYLYRKYIYPNMDQTNNTFSKEVFDKAVKEFLGDNYTFEHGDIKCFLNDGPLYKYDADTGMYSFYGQHGHGGVGTIFAKPYFIDAYEKDDMIIVRAKIVYNGYCGDSCGPLLNFYSSALDGLLYSTSFEEYQKYINENRKDELPDYDFIYSKYSNLLPITDFVLKKQSNGSYKISKIYVE